jgi:hypothetical protein
MADLKITGLTANTAPVSTDLVPMVDDPGGSPLTQKITIANLMLRAPFVLIGGSENDNPADGTTYYWGSKVGLAMSTAAAARRIYFPRACTITAVDLYATFTNGTAETSTISLRLNNTTDTTVSSTVALNATPYHSLVTGLSIAVAAGDYFEFKWVTPTWATNPTGVYWWCEIYAS